MSDFQFIHAADLHLGAPFAGLHETSAELGNAADKATYDAFEAIINLAISEKVLFVLFAGDIYDDQIPNLPAQLAFRAGIDKLHHHGIQSVVIRGNHDNCESQRAAQQFPSSYYEFGAGGNDVYILQHDAENVAAIYGYSYPQRAVTENILEYYSPNPAYSDLLNIGMLHGNVGGDAAHDNYAPCSIGELEEVNLDYWALGHVHQQKVLSPQNPVIAYPGTPQGLSPRETGEHGCFLVSVSQRKQCTLQFCPTASLHWVAPTISVEGCDTLDALLDTLQSELENIAESAGSSIVRLELQGRSNLHAELKDTDALKNTLNEKLSEQPCLIWIDQLTNHTSPAINLDERRQGHDLLGDFLRLSQEAQTDEMLREKVLLALDELLKKRDVQEALGLESQQARQQWLEENLGNWLQEAEVVGADLLLEEK